MRILVSFEFNDLDEKQIGNKLIKQGEKFLNQYYSSLIFSVKKLKENLNCDRNPVWAYGLDGERRDDLQKAGYTILEEWCEVDSETRHC
jgi:hypothetical protein